MGKGLMVCSTGIDLVYLDAVFACIAAALAISLFDTVTAFAPADGDRIHVQSFAGLYAITGGGKSSLYLTAVGSPAGTLKTLIAEVVSAATKTSLTPVKDYIAASFIMYDTCSESEACSRPGGSAG